MKTININKSIVLGAMLAFSAVSYAQIGVGTITPDPSAALDVSATDKGLLIPRVVDPSADIMSPVAGLLAYNTTTNQVMVFDGTAWIAASGTAARSLRRGPPGSRSAPRTAASVG